MLHANSRHPVLLIHGIDDTVALFEQITSYLQVRGWPVHSLDLIPNNGNEGLDTLAQQVVEYVEQSFAPEQPIDLIGFSMGGIVSRYYVQRLGGIHRVKRFITISSPHQGTWTAYLRPNRGASQMRRNSPFLDDLNRDAAVLDHLNFTSIWTPLDLMIVPAHSSRMPIGTEIQIPVTLHSLMMSDPRVLRAVADALSQPLKSIQVLEQRQKIEGRGPKG